jgi:TP901 family phage tail tape measure protein
MADEIGSLAVSLGMDSSGFESGVKSINRSLRVLNSDFKANTAGLGTNGTALDKLRLKGTNLTRTMGLQQNKVSALEAAHRRSVEATGADSAASQNLEIRLNQARTALTNMGNQLDATNSQIATQESRWTTLGTTLNTVGTKMKAAGDKMAKVGKQLAMKVTAPILGLAAASVKAGMDFEASMSNVQAISGASGDDIEALKNKALEMGKATSKSAKESADALGFMALAGWDAKTSIEALEPVLRLSEAGNMDLALTSDLVTDSMSALSLKTKELPGYLDKMAKTSATSNTSVKQLGEAMVVAGGTFKNLNTPMSEANAILGILANRGKKGSEAGNSLNSIMINLTTGAGKAGGALKELNIEAFDGEGKFKGMGDVLKEVREKTKDMTEENRNMYLSMIGGKTQLTTLQALLSGVGEEFDTLQGGIKDSDGALDEMAKTMQDNLKGNMTKLKSALEGIAISLSDTLIPMVSKAAAKIQEWADKFNELSDSQKENIVKVGLFVAAAGPLLLIVGTLVGAAGSLVTGLGAISTAMGITTVATAGVGTAAAGAAGAAGVGGLATVLGGFALAAAPFVLAGAAIVGAGLLIKKSLDKEVIPEVDLFADKVTTTATSVESANNRMGSSYETTTVKISDATEKAVGAYIKLDDAATKELDSLYINGTVITSKILADTTTKYQAMNTSVKTEMDKRFAEEYKTMQDFYAKSDILTKTEEEKALKAMQEKHRKAKEGEDKATAEILAIIKARFDKGEILTLEDEQKIKVIQDRKKETAINIMATQEGEAKIILDRIKAYGVRMTAEQASAEIINANKARDGTIKAAKEKEAKTIASIKATTDQSTPEGKKLADSLIKDAKRQTTETVKKAEDLRSGVVKKIVGMNSETSKSVNTNTGKILTSWDRLKSWWNNWYPKVKKFSSQVTQTTKDGGYISSNLGIDNNASGDRNYGGGLTTLHEKGYEVYNLNKGSQILNHEASLDLVTKTAQEVAKGVLASKSGQGGLNLKIENFVNNRTQDVESLATELAFYMKQKQLGGSR